MNYYSYLILTLATSLSFAQISAIKQTATPNTKTVSGCMTSAATAEAVKKLLPSQNNWLRENKKGVQVKLNTGKWISFEDVDSGVAEGSHGLFHSVVGWDCEKLLLTINLSDRWEFATTFSVDLLNGEKLPTGQWSPDGKFIFSGDLASDFGGINKCDIYAFQSNSKTERLKNISGCKSLKMSAIDPAAESNLLEYSGSQSYQWITKDKVRFLAQNGVDEPGGTLGECQCLQAICQCAVKAVFPKDVHAEAGAVSYVQDGNQLSPQELIEIYRIGEILNASNERQYISLSNKTEEALTEIDDSLKAMDQLKTGLLKSKVLQKIPMLKNNILANLDFNSWLKKREHEFVNTKNPDKLIMPFRLDLKNDSVQLNPLSFPQCKNIFALIKKARSPFLDYSKNRGEEWQKCIHQEFRKILPSTNWKELFKKNLGVEVITLGSWLQLTPK